MSTNAFAFATYQTRIIAHCSRPLRSSLLSSTASAPSAPSASPSTTSASASTSTTSTLSAPGIRGAATSTRSAIPTPIHKRTFSTTPRTAMPSNDGKPNASGLSPSQSRALPTRAPKPDEQSIVQSLRELYACTPKTSSYEMYTSDAVFHDPVGIAQGIEAVKAQFNALPKAFPRADLVKFELLETPSTLPDNSIVVDQVVAYYRKPEDKPFKELNSLLVLKRDASGKVQRHSEEWDHKRETDKSDGVLGAFNEARKKVTAGATKAFASQTPPSEQK